MVNSQKQWNIGYNKYYYYTYTIYTKFLYTYIKKLFLLTEAVFFPDSNSGAGMSWWILKLACRS